MEIEFMQNINVLHISNTPLVGAPGKISKYLSLKDFYSNHFYLNDYPEPLRNFFNGNSILLDTHNETINDFFIENVKKADIIHIHNTITEDICYKIIELNNKCKFVYQVHSPLREPPLYCNNIKNIPLTFNAKLCVSQVHPRLYQDFIMVPNIVDHQGKMGAINTQNIKIIFSPTHSRNNVEHPFSSKYSPMLEKNINIISSKFSEKVKFIDIKKPISPLALLKIREDCHISIDEIATGGFHQVSYEGLACGNVVINNADIFSTKVFADAINSPELPPFVNTDDNNFINNIEMLINDRKILKSQMEASFNYYQKYMKPEKLIDCFIKIYKEIL